jgi:hypothetical protein
VRVDTRGSRGRGRTTALCAAVVTALAGVIALPAQPAAAATPEPHYSVREAFTAQTDSATPGETTYYPDFLRVGTWQDEDGGVHTSRSYVAFDIGGMNGGRLQQATMRLREEGANDCTVPRDVVVRATAAFDANTWASPPALKGAAVPVTASDTGCESWGTFADVTTMLDRALGRGEERLWVELRVPQRHETDIRYGRLLLANEFKLDVTLTNTAPTKPVKLAVYNGDIPCSADYATNTDLSAFATLTDPDRNPYDSLSPQFEYWSEADPGTRVALPYNNGGGSNGTVVSQTLPVRDLADGRYAWHVRSFDGRAYSPWSDPCPFTVDKTAPTVVPTVASPDYPEKPATPTGRPYREGTFLFTANGVADIVAFQYGRSTFDYNRVAADEPGGAATIRWMPRDSGVQTLYVWSVDRAGNRSAPRAYEMNVGTN